MENEVESYINVLNVVLIPSQNQAVQMSGKSDSSSYHMSHQGLQKLFGFSNLQKRSGQKVHSSTEVRTSPHFVDVQI